MATPTQAVTAPAPDIQQLDHEPPIRIVTALAESGIVWKKGDQMRMLDPRTAAERLVDAPDASAIREHRTGSPAAGGRWTARRNEPKISESLRSLRPLRCSFSSYPTRRRRWSRAAR